MANYQDSALWKVLCSTDNNNNAHQQLEQLRSSFLQFRKSIIPIANDISTTLPDMTVHSIEHIDTLWELASFLLGEDFPINPVEVYILGCSFLIHDVGMSLIVYHEGIDTIKNDVAYKDLVALYCSVPHQMEKSKAEKAALDDYLRQRHASKAGELLEEQFGKQGHEFYLLQEADLRHALGEIIGKIAKSHWLSVDELSDFLGGERGAILNHPMDWTINPTKIACILRLSDVINIDASRSPFFEYSYKTPKGISDNHWEFQSKLAKPRLDKGRIVFSSPSSFRPSQAASWWLCYDVLQYVDKELREVDALCADNDLPRFVASSVAGVNSPIRLRKFIPTSGWTPIDASLRVTGVSSVIENLGGKSLYGYNYFVGLRELISNAADAVRARKVLYNESGLAIRVKLYQNAESSWCISIVDSGIGMSPTDMVKNLTDFGASRWRSSESATKFPGLLSRGYKSTGKYGIGFFSAFMIADKITVRSLPVNEATKETHILEFTDGLQSRPLIRKASHDEQLIGGGTEITIVLKKPPLTVEGLFRKESSRFTETQLLKDELAELCFLLDVDLFFINDGREELLIKANEWKTMPPRDFYTKLYLSSSREDDLWWTKAMYQGFTDVFEKNVENILDDNGEIIGRVALAAGLEDIVDKEQWWWPWPEANVYVGGMRTSTMRDMLGVLVGEPTAADRESAYPVATLAQLTKWAKSQAQKNETSAVMCSPLVRIEASSILAGMDIVAPNIPFAFISEGLLTPSALPEWLSNKEEIIVVFLEDIFKYFDVEREIMHFADSVKYKSLKISSNTIILEQWQPWLYPDEIKKRPHDERFNEFIVSTDPIPNPAWLCKNSGTFFHYLLETAAKVWECDPIKLGLNIDIHHYQSLGEDNRIEYECENGTVKVEAIVMKK